MNVRHVRHTQYVLLIVFLLTACARQNSAPTAIATLAPFTTTPMPRYSSGKVDVGGYQLWYSCAGQGSPTVIVEKGLGASDSQWSTVFSAIKPVTRICYYDRAGLGLSDQAPTPRTSNDMVKDLHTLLVNAGITPPYILVGHSIGGFNVRVYASQYPDEIVGMVLVDSSHPDQWSKFLAVIPPETPAESANLKNWRRPSILSDNIEGMDLLISAEQVRSTGSFDNLPLVVISASPSVFIDKNMPVEVAEKIAQAWQELQFDLLNLSSNRIHIVATKAGHNIQSDEPQLVIDAILTMVNGIQK